MAEDERKEDVGDILTDAVEEMTCPECKSVLDVSEVPSFSEIQCPSCDVPLVVPAKLGSFLLIRRLGTGGMGAVYEGVDQSLGRHVAIKVMLKSMSENAASVEILQREARMAATLNHKNIAQIYSFGTVNEHPYIVMELVPGKRLDTLMADGKPLDLRLVLKIGIDVAQGLKAAKEAGLVHGDIKPENILVDKQTTAKVVDFGIAGFADAQAGDGGIWGSPYYIAPEKVNKQKVDVTADMYSLGASLYHALAARPPFDGKTAVEVVKARFGKGPQSLTSNADSALGAANAAIMRMLQEHPSQRHPTYDSLISDLRKALEKARKTTAGGRAGIAPGTVVRTKKHRAVLPAKDSAEPPTADHPKLDAAAPGPKRPATRSSPQSATKPKSAVPRTKQTAATGDTPRKKTGSPPSSGGTPPKKNTRKPSSASKETPDDEKPKKEANPLLPLIAAAILVVVSLIGGVIYWVTSNASTKNFKEEHTVLTGRITELRESAWDAHPRVRAFYLNNVDPLRRKYRDDTSEIGNIYKSSLALTKSAMTNALALRKTFASDIDELDEAAEYASSSEQVAALQERLTTIEENFAPRLKEVNRLLGQAEARFSEFKKAKNGGAAEPPSL